jgi:hypothetical protein
LNISPGTVDRLRVVAINMSTFGEFGDVFATGVSTSFGCPPHPGSTASSTLTQIQRTEFARACFHPQLL